MNNNESIKKDIAKYLNNWVKTIKFGNEERKWFFEGESLIHLSINCDFDANMNHIEKPLKKEYKIVPYNSNDIEANPDENLHKIKKEVTSLENEFKVQFGSLGE